MWDHGRSAVVGGIGWHPRVRPFRIKRRWFVLGGGQGCKAFEKLEVVLGVEEAVDFIVDGLVASSSAFADGGSALSKNEECFGC
jgi:hypothetical protein